MCETWFRLTKQWTCDIIRKKISCSKRWILFVPGIWAYRFQPTQQAWWPHTTWLHSARYCGGVEPARGGSLSQSHRHRGGSNQMLLGRVRGVWRTVETPSLLVSEIKPWFYEASLWTEAKSHPGKGSISFNHLISHLLKSLSFIIYISLFLFTQTCTPM